MDLLAPHLHIPFNTSCSGLLPNELIRHTLPAPISDIAYTNKAVIYDLPFKASAETTLKIAATPKHLGARIGFTSVLHTWGSALTHHPHNAGTRGEVTLVEVEESAGGKALGAT